jgi:hypothetical protein
MSFNRASAPEATPLSKLPHIWILAIVSYGLVIAFTIVTVVVYYHYWPNANRGELELEQRSASITVGSVWMPVYPGALHHDATSTTQGDVTTGDLSFTSNDPPDKLLAFYRSHLQRARFNVMFAPTDTGGRIQAITNRGKTIATLTIASSAAGSDVQIHTRAVETKPISTKQ